MRGPPSPYDHGMHMRGPPSQQDHGIRNPHPRPNVHDDIPPKFIGFTLTKVKKAGQSETWRLPQRTEMKLSEEQLQHKIREEKKKGMSPWKKYLDPEFEGLKRNLVDEEIDSQNLLNTQFKYTLASLTTQERRTATKNRTTSAINVILEREPARTRGRSTSLNEEVSDLLGGPAYPPHGRPPHHPGHEHLAHAEPHEHPDPRLFRNQPGEPWVQVGPSDQPLPPPSPPLPPPQSHPQPHPPPQPQFHPQSHPSSHPHPQPHQSFGDPHLHFGDADGLSPTSDSFGSSPEEPVRNTAPHHHGKKDSKAPREHERKPKRTSLPSDHDSWESLSDYSGFSGAGTYQSGDTGVTDHDGLEYQKRAKTETRRKDSRRESDARRDRSRERRRGTEYDNDDGLDRKDSFRRTRHRRDSDQKAHRPYRTHRRKSPVSSPHSSRESSVRSVEGDYEIVSPRTRERYSPSRRNSQESRLSNLHGRRISSFSHPVDVHDDRNVLNKEIKHIVTEIENEKLRGENEALRRDHERMARENEMRLSEQEKRFREQERLREQEAERMMWRGRDRFDRHAYSDPRSGFSEMRYNQPRSHRFSRDIQTNRFPI